MLRGSAGSAGFTKRLLTVLAPAGTGLRTQTHQKFIRTPRNPVKTKGEKLTTSPKMHLCRKDPITDISILLHIRLSQVKAGPILDEFTTR